jgi:hypothetical protein
MTDLEQFEQDREDEAVGDDGEEIVEQDPDMLYDAWRDAQLEAAEREEAKRKLTALLLLLGCVPRSLIRERY